MQGKRLEIAASDEFNDLTVVGFVRKRGTRYIYCRCRCGNFCVAEPSRLVSGKTKSCGCYHRRVLGDNRRTHGLSRSLEYSVYQQMLERCYDSSHRAYRNYGGRGIRVCVRWRHSILAFVQDVGHRPDKSHTLDRINNEGDYELGNCRWVLRATQNRNKRTNVLVTHNGETKCLTDWAKEYGVNHVTLSYRLKQGWDTTRALTTPTRRVDGDDAAMSYRVNDKPE